MATDKEYMQFVLEQCPEGTTCRSMMGEYVLYYRGKIFGGIYDNRVLIKPVESALRFMPNAQWEFPYEGARQMLLVDKIDDKNFMNELLNVMHEELPAPK